MQSHNTVPLSAGLNFQFVAPLPSDVISGAFYQDKLPGVTSLTGVCADVAHREQDSSSYLPCLIHCWFPSKYSNIVTIYKALLPPTGQKYNKKIPQDTLWVDLHTSCSSAIQSMYKTKHTF